jgi:hypothetical protein
MWSMGEEQVKSVEDRLDIGAQSICGVGVKAAAFVACWKKPMEIASCPPEIRGPNSANHEL